jgi:transposase-like protein
MPPRSTPPSSRNCSQRRGITFERHANNPIEADHSHLKHRLRPMRGLRTDRTAQVIIAGHAFMQNLRRGHYDIAVDVPAAQRVAAALTELSVAI